MNDERARAFAWHQAGNLPGAEQIYRRLLLAAPQDVEVAHYYAVLLSQTGRDQAAVSQLRAVLRRAPARADSWLLLALICRRLGNNAEGLRAATEASQLDPNDAAAMY